MSNADLLRETSGEVAPVLKDAPWLLAVPSLLLAAGFAMDAWVSSLHSVMPVLVGLLKGVAWAFYLRAAQRASGGVEDASPLVAVGALSSDFARGNIRIYRLGDGREVQSIATPAPWITSLAFTPDGKQVVTGLSDTSIVFWDLRRGD